MRLWGGTSVGHFLHLTLGCGVAMKIGFLYANNNFLQAMFKQTRDGLKGHEVVGWTIGQDAPASDFEMLIVMGKFGREQMSAQPKLKFIQTASAGYEGVDLDAANELGIWLSFAESDETGNAVSVAEFAVMLLLGTARHLGEALQASRDHAVDPPRMNHALQGKTVAIVGMGSIGLLLAERLHPFGVTLVATDGHPERAPEYVRVYRPDQIPEAIAEADYVVLCVRADEHNENLFDAAMLGRMKQGAVLVNIARGSLVDEAALAEAIRSGHLAGAGLDVTRQEPMEADNPLLGMPGVLVTPHLAGNTDLMLEGTVKYLINVVGEVAEGKASKSVVNRPERPRLALEGVPERAR